jgi:sugar lactone lactonase YvrE
MHAMSRRTNCRAFDKKMGLVPLLALIAVWALGVCLSAPSVQAQPSEIVFKAPGLYPESFTYYAPANKFYVGSMKFGKIGTVDMTGNYQTVSDDPGLISTLGVAQDAPRKRLLVCISDLGLSSRTSPATVNKTARLAVFDIESGQLTRIVDLVKSVPGRHLANDVVADSDGNAYVTDSWGPYVYKVTPEGEASVFVRDARLRAKQGKVGLDGIAYSPEGYIIVNHYDHGLLYRIDLKSRKVTPVRVRLRMYGADGMFFDSQGRLYVVQNHLATPKGHNAVTLLKSRDHWRSATVVANRQFPATQVQGVILPDKTVYALRDKLELLLEKKPDAETFSIAPIDVK